jgi:hypothetical protein
VHSTDHFRPRTDEGSINSKQALHHHIKMEQSQLPNVRTVGG